MSQVKITYRRNYSRPGTESSRNSVIDEPTSAEEGEAASSGDQSEELESQGSVTSEDDEHTQLEPWTEEEEEGGQTEDDDTAPSSQHPPVAPEPPTTKEPEPPAPTRERRTRKDSHHPSPRRNGKGAKSKPKPPSEETESVASEYSSYEGSYDHQPHPSHHHDGWRWVPTAPGEHGMPPPAHHAQQHPYAYYGHERPPQQSYPSYPPHGAPPPHQGSQLVPFQSHDSYYSNPFTSPYAPSGHNPLSPGYGGPGGGYFDPYRGPVPAMPLMPYQYFQPPMPQPTPHSSHHSNSHSPAPGPDPEVQKTITQLNTMIENQDRAQKEAEARKKLEEDAKAHAAKAANDLSDVQAELKELRAAAAKAKKQAELDEIERLKQEAVASATKQVKEDAEKAAAEKAKKTLEEHEKAIKKVKDAEEEAKKAKKEAEEEAKKLKPPPEDSQPPIKFKDAVGRKFSFPWRHCKTWKGMDDLIQQAFLHVDELGDQVAAGCYDLVGPDGEIILPRIWEHVVKPDWTITMHMWPMAEEPPKEEMKVPVPPEIPGVVPEAPRRHKSKGGSGSRGLFGALAGGGESSKKKKDRPKSTIGMPGGPAIEVLSEGAIPGGGGPAIEVLGDGGGAKGKKANRRSNSMLWTAGAQVRRRNKG